MTWDESDYPAFDPKALRRAKEIVRDYRMVIERADGGGYIGFSAEFPGVFGDGETPEECLFKTIRNQAFCVAISIEKGEPIPQPVSRRARTEQLNLRVSPAEKHELEDAAIEGGYRSVSDFVREAALARMREVSQARTVKTARRASA